MLIISISSNEKENYNGRFFKKQVRPVPFTRTSVNVGGKPCVIIEFNESALDTLDLLKLLNAFRGQIIGSDDVIEKIVPAEYRFDPEPYFKRALLSSLIKNLGESVKGLSVCVKDSNFIMSKEYKELSNKVKSFTLISDENSDTEKLRNFCFVEYGVFVRISAVESDEDYNVFIDFDDIDLNGKIIIEKEGKEQLLYPDPQYFILNDELKALLNFGVSGPLLCAAFQAVS